MVTLAQLVKWCDSTLNTAQFNDYCPNGLQVEGRQTVHKIATSVTASLAAIEAAIDLEADVLLVHHGYFWKGESQPLTGIKGTRIKRLMQADISLIAYHLPLDAHPQYGNNAALADLLEIEITGPLDPTETRPIGQVGRLAHPVSVDALADRINMQLGQPPGVYHPVKGLIQTIGFCSGAAQDFMGKAAQAGCDAYISGEVSERTFHEAQEYGLTYFAAGHHATERYGVQRLGQALAAQFGLKYAYIELDNPI